MSADKPEEMAERQPLGPTANNATSGTTEWPGIASATMSPEAIEAILESFSRREGMKYIPVFVFLIIIMFVGTLGNLLVLLVYCKRFRKTSSNYFIVSMAIFDLLACVIGLPTELYDLLHSFTFYSSVVCKIFRYTEAVTVYGSAIILVEIAIDRYFKICRPLMMVELFKIKMMCIVAGIVAVLVSVPTLALYGISRTPTPEPDIIGHDCSIEEQYRKQIFSVVYYYLLGTVFVVTLVLLSALYIRIWVEIKRRRKLVIGDMASSSRRENIPMTYNGKVRRTRTMVLGSSVSDESEEPVALRRAFSIRPRLESIAETVIRIKVSRTTVVLFAVTVAFVISYLPGITIMICRSAIKDLEDNQSLAEQILSKLFSKFYFVNNAINPVIYSFLNINFRRRCVLLIKKMLTCQRRKSHKMQTYTEDRRSDSKGSNKSTKNEVV